MMFFRQKKIIINNNKFLKIAEPNKFNQKYL